MKNLVFSFLATALSFGGFANNPTSRTTSDVAMFAEPNIMSRLLQVIPADTTVRLVSEQGDFYRVEFRNMTGFVGRSHIARTYPSHCNPNTPGWGNNLGRVSFATNQTWAISGNGITQVWSDAVTATACQKTTFNGGCWETRSFNADCRSNPGRRGDLFSGCAVVRFARQLCPPPWRVPTVRDFLNLDIAMGGTGDSRTDIDFVTSNYVGRWGGAFGGWALSEGRLFGQGSWGYYWSLSESVATDARSLAFATRGSIYPQGWKHEFAGLTLRCIR